MTEIDTPSPLRQDPPQFPMERKCPFQPPAEYAVMRAEEPVAKVRLAVSGKEMWAVSRQEHVRQVLTDPTMSSNFKHPGYPLQVPVPDDILQAMELPLVAMDPPVHGRHRKEIIPEFTLKRMQALTPRIQKIVDEHVDALLAKGGPVDLLTELAIPVPSLVLCELLGVPAEDIPEFRDFAETTVRSDVTPQEVGMAIHQMDVYLDKLVTAKEQNPTEDDLLGRVVLKNTEEGNLNHREIVALARMLISGGFDTLTNMIVLGVAALLEHPDQLAQMKADPELTRNAIEELLRFLSIADSAPSRVATQDLEVGGVKIKAGEGIINLTASANRDETVFENADQLDIFREIGLHSAFGHGVHQCPGASLVRVELKIVYDTLFARIPGLRLAVPVEELPFKRATLIQGLDALPVTW
ncbi:cytochrome P450 [Kitasatospora gansuensis]|uniref:Cytochrome P450 n=1 Tax=Kitasatospora gansuensis TaxID=258050 RepID=A0A7W7SGX6_9ACTN|nr:cytochrome P450 [Kitasatospora gansuensis]MBB4950270.1 cytochrome P450 [Kitasatospora gansuensis]